MSHRIRFSSCLLALAAASLVAGCQTVPAGPLAVSGAAAAQAATPMLRQDAFRGIYEIASTADGTALFVATASGFEADDVGIVHRLDARTLQVLQSVQLPRLSFALGLNNVTRTLYVGHTLNGSLSAVDAVSGMVKGTIELAAPQVNGQDEARVAHVRKVVVDEKHNRVFVTSPGRQSGLVWIVDGVSQRLIRTVTSDGILTAGAAYDAERNRLYVSQSGVNEILEIDPDSGKVVQAFSIGDSTDNTPAGAKHFLVNVALDSKGQRLFATDIRTNRLYVADIASGKFVNDVPIGGAGALGVIYNAARNEVITTHRGDSRAEPQGTGAVTVFDGESLAVKRRFDLPPHPNSLALSPDGQTLYVTVKAPHSDKHPAFRKDARDSVVRIDL